MTDGSAAAGPIDLAKAILFSARSGEQVEVCVDKVRRTEVRVHDASVESFTEAVSFGVGVRVVIGGRVGTAGCGSLDPDMTENLLGDARDNAAFASADDLAGVASPDGHPFSDPIDPVGGGADLSADEKIDMALDVESHARSLDPRVRGVRHAVFTSRVVERAVASTSGIESADHSVRAGLSSSVLIDDVGGGTRTGFAAIAGFSPESLDPCKVAELAVERGSRLVGAERARSARLPVVMPPDIAAQVLGIVASMLSGERVVKGRTPFGNRMGDPIAANCLTLHDDPTDRRSVAFSAVDGEGLACRRVSLIDAGVLEGFLLDSRSARALGMSGTASAVRSARGAPRPGARSIHVARGELDHESVLAAIGEGILVLSLQGLHSGVNPVSGDFSVGIQGIRIRGGRVAEPIKEGTLAGSIPRMLLDIRHVGSDIEYLPGGSVVPTLAIDAMAIGGVSTP